VTTSVELELPHSAVASLLLQYTTRYLF